MPVGTKERRYSLNQVAELSGIPYTTIYRHQHEGKFPTLGSRPIMVSESVANEYIKAQGKDVVLGTGKPIQLSGGNGNGNGSNGKRKYDVNELIQIIADGSTSDAKLAKEQAQALKTVLEVQRRRKDDGELISIEQYRQNIRSLGGKIRNLYMSVADGFLSDIDGLAPTQIQRVLELRLENFGKQLSELDWEEDEASE